MLQIALPHPKQTLDAATAHGGFVWWYVDLRGASGEGLVVIWSLGLPFLPGAREPAAAVTRPAVSIAHYAGGSQQMYLLQNYGEEEADLDLQTGSGKIGQSSYEVTSKGEDVSVRLELDEPLPSSMDRLRGHIHLIGPSTSIPRSTSDGSSRHHLWAPRTLRARARAELNYAGVQHTIDGSGYFDSNVSDTPLHEQGIRSWRWGRISFEDRTFVFYEVEEAEGLKRYLYEQSPNGPMKRLPGRLAFTDERRGLYGLRTPHEVLLSSPSASVWARTEHLVEDGPFYSRSLISAVDENGAEGRGFSEVVIPDKIDRPWQRPLVRMRTHRVGGSNSLFLPLFNGPREGRTGRVLASLWGRPLSA